MSISLPGKIVKVEPGKGFWTFTPYPDTGQLEGRQLEVSTVLSDGRCISPEQRRHIYATLRDIGLWSGFVDDEIKAAMKYEYIARTGNDYFSLSDCNMTTARRFLTFLLDFCVEHGVPCNGSLLDRAPDVYHYVYLCALNRVCCVTGTPNADLHHVDAVGAGRDRKEIVQLGMRVLPLNREKHQEAHTLGRSFLQKYHLTPVRLDEFLVKKLNLD